MNVQDMLEKSVLGYSSRQLMTWREVRGVETQLAKAEWGLLQVDNKTCDLRDEFVDRVTIYDKSRFRLWSMERGSTREIPANAIYLDKDEDLWGREYYLIPIK